jgi:hypothetical protein
MQNASRDARADEISRLFPDLTAARAEFALERWCTMVGVTASLDDADRGLLADFRTGLGYDQPPRVVR